MKESDILEFDVFIQKQAKIWNHPVNEFLIKSYFEALKNYELNDIAKATTIHLKNSRFFFKPLDIIEILENNRKISIEEIIHEAKNKQSVLGVLAGSILTSWVLNNTSYREIENRAKEVQCKIPSWLDKCKNGTFTDHEISLLLKYRVHPKSGLYKKIAVPSQSVIDELIERSKQIDHSKKLINDDKCRNTNEQINYDIKSVKTELDRSIDNKDEEKPIDKRQLFFEEINSLEKKIGTD